MKTTCKRQICNIILSRIKSSDLSARLTNIITDITRKKDFYQGLIVILLSETFRFKLELGELAEILGSATLNNPSFRNNVSIKEFINIEENRISFKSSILAQYLLSNIFRPEVVIDALILLANNLDNKYDVHQPSKEKLISIINFRTIQKAINMNDPSWKKEIFRFYESIKNLYFCKNNIHFWLQYAIARLSDYDYEIAQAYFSKCYELAQCIKGYDTYKIDNHYCRYILENEIETGNISTCMESFNYAHSILINTRKGDEKKHYPFRVAGLYNRFYKKFFTFIPIHQKRIFLTACNEMCLKCEKYLRISDVSNKKKVAETKKLLENIIAENRQ